MAIVPVNVGGRTLNLDGLDRAIVKEQAAALIDSCVSIYNLWIFSHLEALGITFSVDPNTLTATQKTNLCNLIKTNIPK